MRGNGAIDVARAEGHLMELLAVEGLSGREGRVADAVRRRALAAGCKPGWIRFSFAWLICVIDARAR